MKKIILTLLTLGVVALLIVGCSTAKDEKTIKIGATAFPHVEILKVAEPLIEAKGYKLEIQEFSDYTLMNGAVNDKNLDANFFQHEPFLNADIKNHGYQISDVGKVHIEPMGVYSKTIKSLKELKDGDSIAIPNDESNGSRALLLLEKYNIIELKDGVEVPSLNHITKNAKNIKFVEVDAASLPATIDDPKINAAVINTNFALAAKLNPIKDAIVMEDKDSPYANIIVVRTEDKDKEYVKVLVDALHSDEVKEYIQNNLAEQGIVIAF
ncbi:ABC transporter substrate-binding protein [endosymbiont 'TC1' of Trimyema compressum]|uniref:MetQ/NlpA family ABC transporter substrate-binding protein n=1 Tax=endosymbiont 'TC1' of Trimyema compressum TaxID=243899 RepID=UPI0007F07C80|nr:MetQ/NlpA family ABC transporter substrate-binding protein [endosymbiont 'TC1' of Trimyema compressum]AMP20602.1 ABC transporter substrate-binding protein [endosymbiont 'TC1' of Trimyema compressum]